ncbi:MAG: histidinol-phosphate transaminase [Anaerolineae bacterium]|jgi:histidinol-phosphate aminotransferase
MASRRVKQQAGVDALKPYVPGKPIEEVQRAYGLRDVIKLASNENAFGPSPRAVAAIQDRLSSVHLYPDGKSHHLRQAIAAYLDVEAGWVFVANGTDGIIMQTCLAYLDEQSEVIVSESTFPVYDIFAHVMRARLVKVPLQDYTLDLNGMADAITSRTKLIFVCNPNNPTGTIVLASEVAAFMEQVPDHVLVVFDEAYYEFVDHSEFPCTLDYIRQGRANVMVTRTFSKAFGIAGVRVGYSVAVPPILAPLDCVKEPFAVNLLAQAAGIAALQDLEFLCRTVELTQAGRRYLFDRFEDLGLEAIPSHTNFVLVNIGPRALEVQEALLRKGVIVRPCTAYDLPEFLRVTVGTPKENARVTRALADVLGDQGYEPQSFSASLARP